MSNNPDELRRKFDEHDQGHVFAFWDELNQEERDALLADCEYVNFGWMQERTRQFKRESTAEIESVLLEPAPIIRLPQTDEDKRKKEEARAIGEQALRDNRLAAFLVAGGQGTRLGYDGPKGCYPIGPVSRRTLFMWHAEQLRALAMKYNTTIPWYIMTSRANDAATRRYFQDNDFLGLSPDDVFFFQQSMVPSLSPDGKLLLAAKNRLALNPDGHGGSLSALVRSGAIADMRRRGIDTISYFQVDNPLVTICDPVFAGYHLQAGAQMSSKILEKNAPEEKLGHMCTLNGKTTVIEYSDMDFSHMHARDENGRLKFWAGSIAIHMLSVDFVAQVGTGARLPWHIARKKIPYFDGNEVVQPEKPNGIKFETFVFDALPLAASSINMEVVREDEFAPVKNPAGVDSVESGRRLLSNRFAKWLEACGKQVPCDEDGNAAIKIEISPLYALTAEELRDKLPADLKLESDLLLE